MMNIVSKGQPAAKSGSRKTLDGQDPVRSQIEDLVRKQLKDEEEQRRATVTTQGGAQWGNKYENVSNVDRTPTDMKNTGLKDRDTHS